MLSPSKPSRNDLVRLINQLQNDNLKLEHTLQQQMLLIIEMKAAAAAEGFEFTETPDE